MLVRTVEILRCTVVTFESVCAPTLQLAVVLRTICTFYIPVYILRMSKARPTALRLPGSQLYCSVLAKYILLDHEEQLRCIWLLLLYCLPSAQSRKPRADSHHIRTYIHTRVCIHDPCSWELLGYDQRLKIILSQLHRGWLMVCRTKCMYG